MNPEEYPESLVRIYENQSRPRFVRVMGRDWTQVLTKQREEEYLAQFTHPVDGPILDLACGVGNSTQLLLKRFGSSQVIAMDYSSAMIEYCSNQLSGISVIRGTSSGLPFVNGSLGAVNCSMLYKLYLILTELYGKYLDVCFRGQASPLLPSWSPLHHTLTFSIDCIMQKDIYFLRNRLETLLRRQI